MRSVTYLLMIHCYSSCRHKWVAVSHSLQINIVCIFKRKLLQFFAVKKVRKDHSTYIWIIVALGICFVLVMTLLILVFYRTRGSLCQQAPAQQYHDYVSQQYHDTDASQASDAALCDGKFIDIHIYSSFCYFFLFLVS